MTDNTVAIMMATYNGKQYIEEQIRSLFQQTYSDWELFVRDDGSTDGTVSVLETMSRQDERIHVLSSVSGGGSAEKNFATIYTYVKENYDFSYFMFCDQDDVWLPDKIKISMERILQAEHGKDGKRFPVLLHTDLKVVDENLNVLGDSFVKYRALNPEIRDINHLLAQNNVTGCTMLWNRALNDKIDLQVDGIAMHDWWFSTSAALLGRIEFVDTATVLYRQHTDNVVGATKVNSISFILKRLRKISHIMDTIRISVRQAQQLFKSYGKDIAKDEKETIYCYARLKKYRPFQRIWMLHKYHCYKQGLIQVIGQQFFILFL